MKGGLTRNPAGGAAARAKRLDRFMAWLISAGGVLIIAAVLGIMVFITMEALPLFGGAKVKELPAGPVPAGAAVFMDESGARAAVFDKVQGFRCVALGSAGAALGQEGSKGAPPLPWKKVLYSNAKGRAIVQAADGAAYAAEVHWTHGDDGPVAEVEWLGPFLTKPGDELLAARAIRGGGLMGGWHLRVAAMSGGSLAVADAEAGTPIQWTPCPLPPGATPGAMEFSEDGSRLFVGTAEGAVLALTPGADALAADFGEPVTALGFALGHSSLLVGGESGRMAAYQVLRREGVSELQRFHDFRPLDGAVRGFMESLRDKRFLAYSDAGFAVDHLTTESRLARVSAPVPGAAAMSPKGDYVLVPAPAPGGDDGMWREARFTRDVIREIGPAPNGAARMWRVKASHPEVSWGLFWKKIHYEGYSKPEHVWQSSGASDDIEPKFSLVPLLFGTVKGTLYAMLFALPIAVLAALYTSQFASAKFREAIKPTVEIMAALPSVVLGFIAGLVLAPMLEEWMMALLAFVPTTAAIIALLMLAWSRTSKSFRDRYGNGREAIWLVPVIVLALVASSWMAPMVEKVFFGGDYRNWLYAGHGVMFDQRNSIVVGFAMGFAVIPIIFSISEDAFTAVPKSLASASLACGASPWQTAWRVVLPTASPGVFSAVMVGLGRAIGETMIVLMATGNTPLMDWGPFNGMRTLSANIAVEIPEAPNRGTLYRILFFTALLLFALTFVLNTAAELIRQRLRKRYESM